MATSEWGVYFAAYRGQLLEAHCLEFTFERTLFVRTAIDGAGFLSRKRRPCAECPFGLQALSKLMHRTAYHGFGCLAIKERSGGRAAAFIEMNTRLGASNVFVMAPQLIRMLRKFHAKHRRSFT